MQNYGKGFLWSHLVPNLVSPCTRPWHTLYQTLVHLVPYPAKPCAKLCNTLYQALLHLVPDPGTPCTRLGHTLYQTLLHLVLDPATPLTKLCNTLYQTLPVHREHVSTISKTQFFEEPAFASGNSFCPDQHHNCHYISKISIACLNCQQFLQKSWLPFKLKEKRILKNKKLKIVNLSLQKATVYKSGWVEFTTKSGLPKL